jgi:hypothetical protein
MVVWFPSPGERPKPVDRALVRSIQKLRRLPVAALCHQYQEVFGEPSQSLNKQFLFRRLAWQLQVKAEGDLSERARRRAAEIADDADLRSGSSIGFWSWPGEVRAASAQRRSARQRDERLPQPGTMLNRRYRDTEVLVKVLADGFEYQARHYRSLSAIAREVTGTRWNGLLFFGLTERRHA